MNKTGIAREERKKGDIEIGMEEPLRYKNVPRQIHIGDRAGKYRENRFSQEG